ncbi:multicopper oxidase family protein [[Mycobacterium] nativiensis]|uniref:Multicopper oxidase domain-containing protein n=1 Tax=[Mycobacterium] nativiensis TaxID=2855503 RepID=A0ABU5Y037_9MYCO|nr:multicopper oxidase domain-containing protein [Mycolicibacter sp. MYC340]MEB3033382.1 multicopper oxidase domain-containing protein [Mycolicibacter sp. MYC340]
MNRRTFLALMAATGAAGAVGNASTAAHVGGEELRDLPEVSSANGILDYELNVVTNPLELGGRQVTLETYNGQLPGAALRIRPGDNLRILLKNRIVPVGIPTNDVFMLPYCASKSNDARYDTRRACLHDFWNRWERRQTLAQEAIDTNLHTHGLQVSPQDPGDNVFLQIGPLNDHQYSYDVPTDQPAGLYWYHPHFHTATAHQVWNGLSGPIIVEGDIDAVPEIAEMRERTIVINEMWIADDSAEVPFTLVAPVAGPVPFVSFPSVPAAMYVPLNGQLLPDITMQPGEAQRWRVVAATPHRSIWLHVEGHTLHQIGTDGIPYASPRPRPHIMLAAANRAEFIIKAGEPGRYRIYAEAYDQGHPGGPRPRLPLATLVVRGKQVNSPMPSTLVEPPRMPDLPVVRRRTLVFSGDITGRTGMGIQFLIDGKEMDHERIDTEVEAGTIEEWTLVNEDIFQHPIHIHVNPFQVVDVQGIPPGDTSWNTEPDVWWDTFRLPPFGRYTLRMYFRPDITGKTVYHCHILPHEDRGMMGTLLIDPHGQYPGGGP